MLYQHILKKETLFLKLNSDAVKGKKIAKFPLSERTDLKLRPSIHFMKSQAKC